jgi:ankyrin repeat protein
MPLHVATRDGIVEVVRLLVEHCPEAMRAKNKRWYTPLHFAASQGRPEMVRLLVERWPEGATERNSRLNTSLHAAALIGSPEVGRLLLECWPGGKEALNNDGKTPLLMFEEHREFSLRVVGLVFPQAPDLTAFSLVVRRTIS